MTDLMMPVKIGITIAVFVLLQLSCNSRLNFEQALATQIVSRCGGVETCNVPLNDVVGLDWDHLYVFAAGTSKESIERVLGVPIPKYTEFTRAFVLVLDGKIVHFEENPANMEGVTPGEVSFPFHGNSNFAKIRRGATLVARPMTIDRNPTYHIETILDQP